jgi:hypothetical protein
LIGAMAKLAVLEHMGESSRRSLVIVSSSGHGSDHGDSMVFPKITLADSI